MTRPVQPTQSSGAHALATALMCGPHSVDDGYAQTRCGPPCCSAIPGYGPGCQNSLESRWRAGRHDGRRRRVTHQPTRCGMPELPGRLQRGYRVHDVPLAASAVRTTNYGLSLGARPRKPSHTALLRNRRHPQVICQIRHERAKSESKVLPPMPRERGICAELSR